jgi:hypothetical protein
MYIESGLVRTYKICKEFLTSTVQLHLFGKQYENLCLKYFYKLEICTVYLNISMNSSGFGLLNFK